MHMTPGDLAEYTFYVNESDSLSGVMRGLAVLNGKAQRVACFW